MTSLTIKGTSKEVQAIIRSLIKRFGKDTKIIDVCKFYNKERLILT